MKQAFFLSLFALIAFTIQAKDYDFEVDGISYNLLSIEDMTVEVAYTKNVPRESGKQRVLSVPASITVNGRELKVVSIGNKAVYGLPDDEITTIIQSCGLFDRIELPETIETIGEEAFYYQTSIQEIILPKTLKKIGHHAFYHCSNIKKITFNDKLEDIGYQAFCSCDQWEEDVVLPESVKKIGSSAFADTSIRSFKIPHSIEECNGFLQGCKALEFVDLEPFKSFGELPGDLFRGSGIKRVIIPDWATFIPNSFVKGCEIDEFKFGNSIEEIRESAFRNCKINHHLVLPSGLKKIKDGAFYNLNVKGSLVIPASVEKIGYDSMWLNSDSLIFQQGDNVLYFYYYPGESAFFCANDLIRVERGVEANDWINLYAKVLELGKNFVSNPPPVVFYGSNTLRLVILEGVEDLDLNIYCYYNSQKDSLNSILLPSSLKSISTTSFQKINNLTNIDCRAIEPPTCDGKIIPDKYYMNVKLTVPKGSKDAYMQAQGWKYFWNIEETDIPVYNGSGIQEVIADDAQWFSIQDGSIHATAPIDVFSIDGQLLRRSATGQLSDIPKGCYIIRCGARTAKVNVAY